MDKRRAAYWVSSSTVVLLVAIVIMAAGNLTGMGAPAPAGAGPSPDVRASGELPLVPLPRSLKLNDGVMALSPSARICVADASLLPLGKILADEIFLTTGRQLGVVRADAGAGDIALAIDSKLKNEAYQLTVGDRASVSGADYNGVAMGTVTLLQAIKSDGQGIGIPHLVINDESRFKYCAAMLDIARKPHSIETLKACVEAARMYKIRFFQLHMSDDNAWTFPSTKYPQIGNGNTAWAGGEKAEVYKVADLKDLVAFADARGVTIVPELEAAGHSSQLCVSMPDVFQFRTADGKFEGQGVLNPCSPRSYEVLDTLVSEAADIFKSSPYIHMGCDEANYGGIIKYPDVQAMMAREHLADGGAVFNYHITKLDEIVKKYGKQMIVWEGAPLDPVKPPKDVIYMPWVGASGFAGVLVKDGYDIINAPWGTKKAYMDPFEVNGAQIDRGDNHLIGATAIQWQAEETLALPFMRYGAALRNEPTRNPDSGSNLDDFNSRLAVTDVLLDRIVHGFHVEAEGLLSPSVYARLDPAFAGTTTLKFAPAFDGGTLHYTLDRSEPTEASPVYSAPIVLDQTTTVRAKWFGASGDRFLYPFMREFHKVTQVHHDAVGAKVTITPDLPGYYGPGPRKMTDGVLAMGNNYTDAGWVGWLDTPVQIDIDLGTTKQVKTLSVRTDSTDGGVTPPDQIEFQLSDNGKDFHTVATVDKAHADKLRNWFRAELPTAQAARYVRANVSKGNEWNFIDQVMVNGELPGPEIKSAALGKKVTFAIPPDPSYSNGDLTDGYITSTASFKQAEWLGWQSSNVDATIDLGKSTDINEVGGHFLQNIWGGVRLPHVVTVSVSDDGVTFHKVADINTPSDNIGGKVQIISTKLTGVTGRYVKFFVQGEGAVWIFTDELFVNPEK